MIGLKENVIIGKLIPAGTGCHADRETSQLVAEKAAQLRAKREERNHHDESGDGFMSFLPQQDKITAEQINEIMQDDDLSVVEE